MKCISLFIFLLLIYTETECGNKDRNGRGKKKRPGKKHKPAGITRPTKCDKTHNIASGETIMIEDINKGKKKKCNITIAADVDAGPLDFAMDCSVFKVPCKYVP